MKTSRNIFLVDDDEDDQLFFVTALNEIEHATLLAAATNGKEALRILESTPVLPDIIFMDINMPVMTGIECLGEIKKNPQISEIPIVILTSDTSQAELAYTLGAKAFIKKPWDLKTLRSKLEQMINLDFISDSQIANETFKWHF